MNLPEKWQWLLKPLERKMRWRLETTLGVVLSGAAVIALSTMIQPDPSKYLHPVVVDPTDSLAERRADAHLRTVPPAEPDVSPELLTAVAHGDIPALDRLYRKGMSLTGTLGIAAEAGDTAVVRWLLDHDANTSDFAHTINAPLLLADEHSETVALLLEHGVTEPSLAVAAEAGAVNAVHRILGTHPNVNEGGDDGEATPLYAAISSARATSAHRREIVDTLLAAGADPNLERGERPLITTLHSCEPNEHAAREHDCVAIIKMLVKRGARVNNDVLVAALAVDDALRDDSLDAVLKAPIDPGATAAALAQSSSPSPKTIKLLVRKRVDWAWHDGEDDAAIPLLSAVQRGERDYVRALLDAGAPADVHYKDATCALGEAINGAANDNADFARIVELLVARGVDVNRRLPDGRTPLFAAAEGGQVRVINALLERGARLNDLVLDDTALDAAEQNNHQPAARVLHARGARRARKTPDVP